MTPASSLIVQERSSSGENGRPSVHMLRIKREKVRVKHELQTCELRVDFELGVSDGIDIYHASYIFMNCCEQAVYFDQIIIIN